MGLIARAALLTAAIVLLASPIRSQNSPKGTLAGDVVDVTSGQGIAGARVRIQSGQLDPLFATADAQGHFQFAALDMTGYQVSARAPGFMNARENIGVGLTRTAPDGTVRIELRRYGVITGRVTDAQGVPLPGVTVDALVRSPPAPRSGYSYSEDGVRYFGVVRGQTDDRGEYRLAPLPAGPYLVFAQSQLFTGYYVQPEIRPPTDPPQHNTFYPNALKAAEAKPVIVAEDKEARADVAIARAEGVTVSGNILGLENAPAGSTTTVVLRPVSPSFSGAMAQVSNGRFSALHVLPGKYVVGVGTYQPGDVYLQNLLSAGRRTIDVGTAQIDDADVTLGPAPQLSGTVEFAGGCTRQRVWMALDSDLTSTPTMTVMLDGDGHFSLGSIFPGHYRILAGMDGVAGSVARSVKLGDTEGLTGGVEVTADNKLPLRITLACPAR